MFLGALVGAGHYTRLAGAHATLQNARGRAGRGRCHCASARIELVRDLLTYELSRAGRVPIWVGMPCVVYADAAIGLGVVVDSLPFVSGAEVREGRDSGSRVGLSVVPDWVVVRSWNEVVWDFVGGCGSGTMANTKMSVQIERVRLSVHNTEYHLTYSLFAPPPTWPASSSNGGSTTPKSML